MNEWTTALFSTVTATMVPMVPSRSVQRTEMKAGSTASGGPSGGVNL